jgi:hypothetical protein
MVTPPPADRVPCPVRGCPYRIPPGVGLCRDHRDDAWGTFDVLALDSIETPSVDAT